MNSISSGNHPHSSSEGGCCGCSGGRPGGDSPPATNSLPNRPSALRKDLSAELIEVPAGTFLMGSTGPETWKEDGEGPVREVSLDRFFLDATAVTNGDFEQFVRATGYQTDAEKFGWSYVFHLFLTNSQKKRLRWKPLENLEWWLGVEGAYWKKPEGSGSNVKKRMNHPVVHVSWNDAVAFAAWAGKRLPTEAEWEYAGRAGTTQLIYPWGNELVPGGKFMANTWQGKFPVRNTAADGYSGTAPVKSFRPNAWGFYNMIGNVWEWVEDRFSPTFHKDMLRVNNPKGPPTGDRRVTKGGSYLCHESYCNRYRLSARSQNTPDSSLGNTGFRCAADAPN